MKKTFEGESIRLSNELRAKPARTILNVLGQRVEIPAKQGFDIETADYLIIKNWLNGNAKKSQSLFWFVVRTLALRFPDKHTEIKRNLALKHKLEFELILSELRNEVEFLGKVGFSGMVRLDKSLTKSKNKVVIDKNENVSIKRK